MHKIAKENRLI